MSGIAATLQRRREKDQGIGTNSQAVKYLNQDYETLRQRCFETGRLFQDDTFPALPASLGFKELGPNSYKTRGVSWKRPTELVSNPEFIMGGATRTDICQGALGDCWLLAAIASLTLNEYVMARVVPTDQGFGDDYAGIFHFQFWQFGEWVDVVIDDRLPVKDGELMFVHSAEGREFWSALLEKAYAKLPVAPRSGPFHLTPGVPHPHQLLLPTPVWTMWTGVDYVDYVDYVDRCGQVWTGVDRCGQVWTGFLQQGAPELPPLRRVDEQQLFIFNRQTVVNHHWTGAWSDDSTQWRYISDEDRERLSHRSEDGEFWMSFSDFLRHYSRLEICNLTPDALSDDSVSKWALSKFDGSWRRGSTAGGCRNFPNSFWTNPQFVIKLEEEDDDPDDGEAGCSFVVGLIQKNRRKLRKQGEDMHTVGFAIYEVPKQFQGQTQVHLDKNFFLTHAQTAKSETFINLREVCSRFKLPPGEYLIVPSTFEPHLNGDFCIRVFSEKQTETKPCDDPVNAELEDELVSDEDVDAGFRGLFSKLAGDDMEISAVELRTIMNKIVAKRTDIRTDGFSLETCRVMVNLMDDSGNGKLGLGEFATLWKKVQRYLSIYKKNDLDNSGTMSTPEMRVAFKDAGQFLFLLFLQEVLTVCEYERLLIIYYVSGVTLYPL
ncbi:calpain-2 catalytic subunit-like [Morone saxatilis]|uniref:calpain-2 catalytic subunit-like n=1 Tax=Morone saxatilis TaxID=34816 RepID=UPI0015E23B38|nr:calpain-2 catalytic subunit-like [Morone saxatilis]